LNPNGARDTLGLYPNSSYRSMLGLVALFGRASSHPTNPRAPHTQLCAVTGFSYATVTMNPVENGRGGRGTRFQQWAGVSTVGQGSGQGSMFGRGGFPSMTQGFHPGYDSRGPYSGYGGGRYSGRGRPGDWAAQSNGGFAGRQGQDAGNNRGQILDMGSRDNRVNREQQIVSGVNRVQQFPDQHSSEQEQNIEVAGGKGTCGGSSSTASVSVGGRNFNLSEHATVLLQ
jgi:hypothetical protein